MTREFDILVYGATGINGSFAARYLTGEKYKHLKIAIAGRRNEALIEVATSCKNKPTVIVANTQISQQIEDMLERTNIVINCAGPFSKTMEVFIKACIDKKTHYVDITGEVGHVGLMIARYQKQAVEAGISIIPCSGFDSVPADLAVFLLNKEAKKLGRRIDTIHSYYSLKGGVNSGSIKTAFDMDATSDRRKAFKNANCLIPGSDFLKAPKSSLWPKYSPLLKCFHVLFLMDPINRAIVTRSQDLRGSDCDHITYEGERLTTGKGFLGFLRAVIFTASLAIFYLLSRSSRGRNFIIKYFESKKRPSDADCQNGYTKCSVVGYENDNPIVRVTMSGKGDPGVAFTTAAVCESAILLHENGTKNNGFLTPSTAFCDDKGDNHLIRKLASAGDGYKFEIKSSEFFKIPGPKFSGKTDDSALSSNALDA